MQREAKEAQRMLGQAAGENLAKEQIAEDRKIDKKRNNAGQKQRGGQNLDIAADIN